MLHIESVVSCKPHHRPAPAKQNGTEESVVSGRNTAVVKNKTDFLHGMSVSLAEYLVLARDKTRSLTIKV